MSGVPPDIQAGPAVRAPTVGTQRPIIAERLWIFPKVTSLTWSPLVHRTLSGGAPEFNYVLPYLLWFVLASITKKGEIERELGLHLVPK